jgi:phage regulator Rha-like protein
VQNTIITTNYHAATCFDESHGSVIRAAERFARIQIHVEQLACRRQAEKRDAA